ncbi:MAG: 4-(cytidine 5'-diphospho)-2-C-methyl-D-erythritol kinase [Verrucomicrobiota bacterium]
MPATVLFSPAKLNLYLHITGKRPDGFHELDMLMVPIDFGDELSVRVESTRGESRIALSCDQPDLPVDGNNLCVRAAEAFLKRYGLQAEVDLQLRKRIPVGAGLGGGSSNGATVLLALRELLKPDASDAELAELAARFGSDTAFFIYQRPAVCRGRGEIIEPRELTQDYQGLLVHPGFGVATPWAYRTYAADPKPGVEGKTTADGFALRNDLEPPAFGKHLWLPATKEWFQAQPEVWDALMSGSGSSVFALVEESAAISGLRERFHRECGESLFSTPFRVTGRDRL